MGWERDERDEKVENFERGTKPENYLVTLESGVPKKNLIMSIRIRGRVSGNLL